ncbi:MAG: tyrosine-protein phosphatase [Bosea sp. (in: a-proteobacteria)]
MLNIFKTPEERWTARQQRIGEWDRPLVGRGQRRRAWLNMLFADHGIIRLVYLNRHKVTPRFERAAQPGPHDIERFAKDGIRTLVNLRGGRENGAWPLQREACERNGIVLAELTIRSRAAPNKETLLALPAFFASLAYPVLVHCKSGADRAGLFSALYLLIQEGLPVAEAKKQLALKYGHVRLAKTGMLDAFLEAFERDGEAKGISFLDWVKDIYDPAKVEREFHAGFWSSLLIDRLMRRE